MKKLAALLMTLSFCFALSVSLDQPSLHIETERGKTSSHKIKLTNNNDTELRLRVYVNDWGYTADGAKEFKHPAAQDNYYTYSCADWLFFKDGTELRIPPLSSKDFRFEVKTPANAEGGHQAVIFFETESADVAVGGVSYGARLGTLIYQKTKKHTVDSIEPLLLKTKLQDGAYIYDLSFTNNGNAWNSVQGSLALIQDGDVLDQVELDTRGLLPGGSADYTGSFAEGVGSTRVEVLYMIEDYNGQHWTGQLLAADSAESISQTRVWVEKFAPVYSKAQNALQISCEVASISTLRVSPIVKIYNTETKTLVKTVEFNPKVLRPDKVEKMTISWPIGSSIIGSLPAGEYNCVLSIKHGNEVVTDTKIVRID